jgi:hypothetical protein
VFNILAIDSPGESALRSCAELGHKA